MLGSMKDRQVPDYFASLTVIPTDNSSEFPVRYKIGNAMNSQMEQMLGGIVLADYAACITEV
jgi:hypothetical protein